MREDMKIRPYVESLAQAKAACSPEGKTPPLHGDSIAKLYAPKGPEDGGDMNQMQESAPDQRPLKSYAPSISYADRQDPSEFERDCVGHPPLHPELAPARNHAATAKSSIALKQRPVPSRFSARRPASW